MTIRARRAFTLFQLLVILALLLLLFALLLPAVFKLRSAAARSQSTNNLKQIALACHNYADANASFPPGNDAHNFSAAAYLLPYLEQNAAFTTIDFTKPCDDKANDNARGVIIKTFLNPNDPVMAPSLDSGPTNYLYNAGSKADLKDDDGIFYQDSKIRFADITDGTSNTILAGETLKGDGKTEAKDVHRQHVKLEKGALKNVNDETGEAEWKNNTHIAGDRCGAWIDGRFLQGTFTGTRLPNAPSPDVSCGGAGGLSALRSLDQNITFAMCDGSVRTSATAFKADTWKYLTARNDGMPIPNF
jgi:type II secretory pathway pseudopilin PulG